MLKKRSSDVSEELFSFAMGSTVSTFSYIGCVVNGVKFVEYNRDILRKTQNSGVYVPGE